MSQVPTGQRVRLAVGITGHRGGGGTPGVDEAPVAAALAGIIDRIEAGLATTRAASPSLQIQPTRLHSLLAPGVDQLAAIAAERRGWEIVAPLPFGRRLNVAINAHMHRFAWYPKGAADNNFPVVVGGGNNASTGTVMILRKKGSELSLEVLDAAGKVLRKEIL